MKAKLGSKEDREYYQQYCKQGVDFAKLVLFRLFDYSQVIHALSNTVKCKSTLTQSALKAVLYDSESSRAAEGWLVSGHADAQQTL